MQASQAEWCVPCLVCDCVLACVYVGTAVWAVCRYTETDVVFCGTTSALRGTRHSRDMDILRKFLFLFLFMSCFLRAGYFVVDSLNHTPAMDFHPVNRGDPAYWATSNTGLAMATPSAFLFCAVEVILILHWLVSVSRERSTATQNQLIRGISGSGGGATGLPLEGPAPKKLLSPKLPSRRSRSGSFRAVSMDAERTPILEQEEDEGYAEVGLAADEALHPVRRPRPNRSQVPEEEGVKGQGDDQDLAWERFFQGLPSAKGGTGKRKHEEGSPSVSGRHACAGRRHSQQSGCDVACTPERAPFPRDVEFFGSSPVTEDLHSGTGTGSDSAFSSLTEDVKERSMRLKASSNTSDLLLEYRPRLCGCCSRSGGTLPPSCWTFSLISLYFIGLMVATFVSQDPNTWRSHTDLTVVQLIITWSLIVLFLLCGSLFFLFYLRILSEFRKVRFLSNILLKKLRKVNILTAVYISCFSLRAILMILESSCCSIHKIWYLHALYFFLLEVVPLWVLMVLFPSPTPTRTYLSRERAPSEVEDGRLPSSRARMSPLHLSHGHPISTSSSSSMSSFPTAHYGTTSTMSTNNASPARVTH